MLGIEPSFLRHPACSQATIQTAVANTFKTEDTIMCIISASWQMVINEYKAMV
jgi:hypothetical protein